MTFSKDEIVFNMKGTLIFEVHKFIRVLMKLGKFMLNDINNIAVRIRIIREQFSPQRKDSMESKKLLFKKFPSIMERKMEEVQQSKY